MCISGGIHIKYMPWDKMNQKKNMNHDNGWVSLT